MKTDTYTKIVLTIIAIALTLNLLKSTITPVKAENRNFVNVPINPDGTISVRIKQMPKDLIDVNIASASKYSLYDAGPIEVKSDN